MLRKQHFNSIIFIVSLIAFPIYTCPYKNFQQNQISEQDFFQSIEFQRSKPKEIQGFSFGFYYWIQRVHLIQGKIQNQLKDPFQEDSYEDGELILNIEENGKMVVLHYYNGQNILETFSDSPKFFDFPNFEFAWKLIIIIFQPKEFRMLYKYSLHNDFLNFPLSQDSSHLTINLGGHLNINRRLNLNLFRGKATKLQVLDYFSYDENTYENYLNFCIVPDKFIVALGQYTLTENSCQVGCLICDSITKDCLICDTELNGFFYSQDFKQCDCSHEYLPISFDLPSTDQRNYICVELEIAMPCISVIELPQNQESYCDYGYFSVFRNEQYFCIQCPLQTFKSIGCVECLTNKLWYIEPVCKSDFIQINDHEGSAYEFKEREQIDYEVFIIDQIYKLVYQAGVQKFCFDENIEKCFELKSRHLGQTVLVKCKQNYFQYQGNCIFLDQNCIDFANFNECTLCKTGFYLKAGLCFQCLNNCETCIYSDEIICLNCAYNYYLIDNQCQPCSHNCSFCLLEYDQLRNEKFLRCLKCVDDSKFFLSFDGVNCLENYILNCKYAIQVMKEDISISTIKFQFTRQLETDKIQTICALCFDQYTFIFSLQKCLKYDVESCVFGYSDGIIEDSKFQENKYIDIVFDGELQIQVQKIKCLIKNQPLVKNCSFIQNCLECPQNTYFEYFCLRCELGYYLDIFTNQCYFCQSQDCLFCIQQNRYLKDEWKYQLYPFFQEFIYPTHFGSFISDYTFSRKENQYNVICKQCLQNQELNDGSCFVPCLYDGCSKCEIIKNKNICVDCKSYKDQGMSTLQESFCIRCPIFCEICLLFKEEEVFEINPFYKYDKTVFPNTSNQKCFKPSKILEGQYFYDKEIYQFVKCNKYVSGCIKQLLVQLEFNCKWNQSQQERKIYTGPWGIYERLIEFYKITSLKIQFTAIRPTICNIEDEQQFEQTFNKQILILKSVELEINCFKPIIWNLFTNIVFDKFTKITINGLILNIFQNNALKKVIFQSLQYQYLYFNNVQVQHLTNKVDKFQMIFHNITLLCLSNVSFKNFQIDKNVYLFDITQINDNQTLNFSNVNFSDLICENSNLIQVAGTAQKVILNNLAITGTFKQVIFINIQMLSELIILSNTIIKNSKFQDCLNFFNFQQFKRAILNQIRIENTAIASTILFISSSNNQIEDFNIKNCLLQSQTKIIVNPFTKQNQSFSLKNISFVSNRYSIFSAFLHLQGHSSEYSKLQLANAVIQDNLIEEILDNVSFKGIDIAQFIISLVYVEINNLYNERCQGKNNFLFQNVHQFIITSSLITQKNNSQLKIFPQCSIQNLNFGITFVFSSTQKVIITNVTVLMASSYDSPIFYFLSKNLAIQNYNQIIKLSQITFQKTLLIQTQLQTKVALIVVESNQQLEIFIENSTFRNNILQALNSDKLIISALLINIYAQNSQVELKAIIFENNMILNSSASIIYIASSQINIENCSAVNNNKFSYATLQLYLLWTFEDTQQIFIENLKQIIPIQSLSGFGYFQTKLLNITNSSFEICQGIKATSIFLRIHSEGRVMIDGLRIYSNHLDYFEGMMKGSVIYLDSPESSDLSINIQNVEAKQIYSNQKGGLLYIIKGQGKVFIQLANIYLTDIFSIEGTIVYLNFEGSKSVEKKLYLKNINFFSTLQSYKNFVIWYNYFIQYQNKSKNQIVNLMLELKGRSLVSILGISIVRISVLNINGLFFENAFLLNNTKNVYLSTIIIQDSFLNDKAIVIAPDITAQAQILIEDIKIINILFGYPQFNQSIFQVELPQSIYQLCAIKQNYTSPLFLNNFLPNQEEFIKKINYTIITTVQLSNSQYGIISLNRLNQIHQIKLNNLEIIQISCNFCQNGLLSINFTKSISSLKKQEINNIVITNSSCGLRGCFTLIISSTQILENTEQHLQKIEFYLSNYICQFNLAYNGSCLYLYNVGIMIQNSNFRYNNATGAGGAIYSRKSNSFSFLLIKQTVIQDNTALIGGGIFLEDQQELNFESLDTIINGNKAELFANDVSAIPSQLLITIGGMEKELFEIKTLAQSDQYQLQMQQLKNKMIIHGISTNYPLLPNGNPLAEYQYFNWRNGSYIPLNITFRVQALTKMGVQMKNLKDTYCKISSRIFLTKEGKYLENLTDGLTNFKIVYFNQENQDYNLDNLILYKRENFEQIETFELEFWYLSLQFAFITQSILFKNANFNISMLTRGNQKSNFSTLLDLQFRRRIFLTSIKQNQLLDQGSISTIEVQPALLNLRDGYWRPYFDTSWVSNCLNSLSNCQGGWFEGDKSCAIGHIGALCEQCDIYDIRGQGYFSQSQLYQCESCLGENNKYFYLSFHLAWSFLFLSFSTLGSIETGKEKIYKLKLQRIGLRVYFKPNFKVVLLKILTNYHQIFSLLSTFQLNFPSFIQNVFFETIFSNQSLNYAFDCFISKVSQIEIQYLRMIWLLIFPLIQLNSFFLLYGFASIYKKKAFNLSVLSTSLINLYCYFYPSLTWGLIQLLSYRNISGYTWISSNVAYRYDRENHLFWILYFCVPAVLIISILIPLILARILYKNHKKLDSKNNRQNFGYLYNEYKQSNYFWEIIRIVQKECIIFFIIFFEEEVILKGSLIILILIFYETISGQLKPYSEHQLSRIDYIQNQILLLSFVLSVGIYGSQNVILINMIFKVLILYTNFHFLMHLIFLIFKEYLSSFQQIYEKLLDKILTIIRRKFPNLESRFGYFFRDRQAQQAKIKNYFEKLKQFLRQQAKIAIRNQIDQPQLQKSQE